MQRSTFDKLSRGNSKMLIACISLSIACIFLLAYSLFLKHQLGDVEEQLAAGQQRISQMEADNAQLNEQVDYLRNAYNRACGEAQMSSIHANDLQQRMQSAQSHLNQAQFWNEAGDEFQASSSLNQAKNDVNGW